jgi:hypothetical protein
MKKTADIASISSKFIKRLSILLITIMALTGAGQMPIFKRYYIADIPGLGWTGDYYITHVIHYSGAVMLIALAVYLSAEYYLKHRSSLSLSKAGWVRVIVLAGLFLSGILKVISNLKGVYFVRTTLISLDLIHTALMFILLITFAVSGIMKSGLFEEKNR